MVEINAFLTNLGKYNEGVLQGEWVSFPISAEEYQKVLQRIGINRMYEEFFITDYVTEPESLANEMGEFSDVEELNYLAGRLKELDEYSLKKYEAVLKSGVGYNGSGVMGLINLADNLDCYFYMQGVNDDYDLGDYWINESGAYDLDKFGMLKNYFDYERFGRDIRLEESGCYVSDGYVTDNGDSWIYYYNGDKSTIPDEYKLGTEGREKDVTMER